VSGLPARDTVPYLDIWPSALRTPGVEWDYPTAWPLRPAGAVPGEHARPAALADLPYDRTVYVTAGTSYHHRPGVLDTMIAGLRDAEVNVIATIGRDGDRRRFGPQPAHVRIEHFVPQDQLLPHVDAVVCHAGAGTTLGALAHGRPMVVVPQATDQFDLAAQVVAVGAGVCTGPDVPTREGIRDAVHTVLAGPGFRDAAGTVAGRITAMPTPAEVIDRLLAHVS
jgi:UDP:flavonoid glycosyltransferase YjiC (YdhE family)